MQIHREYIMQMVLIEVGDTLEFNYWSKHTTPEHHLPKKAKPIRLNREPCSIHIQHIILY